MKGRRRKAKPPARLKVRVTKQTKSDLQTLASAHGLSSSQIVEMALRRELPQWEKV
jgi:antitoxin component of RelBE/YafQ-DinJ toxin-antitoxin module